MSEKKLYREFIKVLEAYLDFTETDSVKEIKEYTKTYISNYSERLKAASDD